jgi:nucleoside-diphosphate-sugar epimerase
MTPTTFVTGGTGFLGRHLIPALCRAGHTVRVLARDPQRHPWLQRYSKIEIVRGNVLDADSLEQAAGGVDYTVHAAGYFRFWGDERDFETTNVAGTENVLRAAGDVRRFVQVSTVVVIGNPEPGRVVDETHPPRPADAYQRSKLRGETTALQYQRDRGVPVIVVRPGAFYGTLGSYAFNRLFFRDPLRGIIMQINGGTFITFPVYIADVAQGIVAALERGRVGEIYNLCGESLTHREAFDIICEEGHIRAPRLNFPDWAGEAFARLLTAISRFTGREPFYPLSLRSYVYNDWRVSSDKAKRELGFAPIDFRSGARRTLAWYRAGQPDWIPEVEC